MRLRHRPGFVAAALAPVVAFALVLLAAASSGAAAGKAPTVVDPPARVGRVALVLGHVDYFNETLADWSEAAVNLSVTSRSALATAGAGRAEVRIGAVALRLDGASQASVVQLDDAGIEVELTRGSLQVSVPTLPRGDRVALAAGALRLQVSRSGRYRLDFDPSTRQASVLVLDGAAEMVLAGQRVPLQAQQHASVDTQTGTITVQALPAATEFDAWCAVRDRAPEPLGLRRRYVPASMTGAEVLDEYGRWQADSVYGPVWYPANVSAGWAPFRAGHWLWMAPWGWTWIDDAPWGFAPSHYGRWAFIGGRWGWVPGAYVARPVYAPALVAFYGGLDVHSVGPAGASGALVGWCPLGPADVWVPAYPASMAYVRSVNSPHVTNTTTIGNAIAGVTTGSNTNVNAAGTAVGASGREYRYAQTSFAATAVPQGAFTAGQSVAQAQITLTPAQLAAAPAPSTRLLPAAPAEGSASTGSLPQRFAPPPHAEAPPGALGTLGLAAAAGGQRAAAGPQGRLQR
jgi:hypothetical protein